MRRLRTYQTFSLLLLCALSADPQATPRPNAALEDKRIAEKHGTVAGDRAFGGLKKRP